MGSLILFVILYSMFWSAALGIFSAPLWILNCVSCFIFVGEFFGKCFRPQKFIPKLQPKWCGIAISTPTWIWIWKWFLVCHYKFPKWIYLFSAKLHANSHGAIQISIHIFLGFKPLTITIRGSERWHIFRGFFRTLVIILVNWRCIFWCEQHPFHDLVGGFRFVPSPIGVGVKLLHTRGILFINVIIYTQTIFLYLPIRDEASNNYIAVLLIVSCI